MPQQQESPLDHAIMQMHAISALQPDTTGDTVKMLATLYGIKEGQDKAAEEAPYLRAHAAYFQNMADELHGSRQARAMQENASALKSMYEAGLPRDIIEAHARDLFGIPQTTPVAPKDSFAPGTTAPVQPYTAKSLGQSVRKLAPVLAETSPLTLFPYLGQKIGQNFNWQGIKDTANDFYSGLTQ